MSQSNSTFTSLVSLSGIEYPEEIELGLVGCYVYQQTELLDVLVLSDADQKLKITNLTQDDLLRFECKLLGTQQRFLGSVSFTAEKLLMIAPGESWSQLLPLFDEGEDDEYKRDFGDVKVVPPCILLTFQPTDITTSSTTTVQTTTVVKSKTKTSSQKPSIKSTISKKKETKTKKSKPNKKEKVMTLEERVVEKVNELDKDMKDIQSDDRQVVDRLKILQGHNNTIQERHPVEEEELRNTAIALNGLTQTIGEDSIEDEAGNNENPSMKQQDRIDLEELEQSKQQLKDDVSAATNDLEILLKDNKDLNDYITDKSGQTYDTHNGTVPSRQNAIRAFLVNTLSNSHYNLQPLYKENAILSDKVKGLRNEIKDKMLNSQVANDQDLSELTSSFSKSY